MLELSHSWTSTGGSGGLDPVRADFAAWHTVLYVQGSTVATTFSFQLQTAISSGGPWYSEGSTSLGNDANNSALAALRLTGPYHWARPYFPTKSTGAYTVRLIAVGD